MSSTRRSSRSEHAPPPRPPSPLPASPRSAASRASSESEDEEGAAHPERQARLLKEMRRLMPGSRSHARRAASTSHMGAHEAGPRLRARTASVSYREPSIRDLAARSPEPATRSPQRAPPLRAGEWIEVEVSAWERIETLDTGEVRWFNPSTGERRRDEPGAAWLQEVEWRPAQVRALLGGGRFSAVINNDEAFVEEYGPDDEGKEWRRSSSRYGGLKRQRKSVDHYQPEVQRARALDGDGRSLQVGPFRMGPRPPRASGGSRSRRRIGEGFGARRRQRSGGGGSSDESTTNNSEEEFEARKKRSEARLRGAIRPIGGRGAASLAGGATVVGEGGARVLGPAVGDVGARGDVQPMAIEAGGGWSKVGGLEGHVKAIKEMVLMPLLYPHVFASLGVTPPRGVLLHGPPGTGKTLVARALAQSCCAAGRSVNFFMRKGADVLSKWVGEAEKQLRLLFEEATRLAPSIIFFDEIDGLAPVRSSKQDYIHASIVSTLLALMDGLDSRGQVILIGATNRIDSLDAALRRPGRFDRELQFALPSSKDREAILRIHTDAWQPPPAVELLSELAARTHGFCGADLKALCAEAALRRLRATFPQVFEEEERYEIDAKGIVVLREDFLDALSIITPAAQRSVSLAASPLPPHLVPLLARPLEHALDAVKAIFPPLVHADGARSAFRGAGAPLAVDVGGVPYHTVCRPRLLLHGPPGNGQTPLALAILHALEHCHLYSLELAALTSAGHSSIAEACARVLAEARRTPPAVVLLPSADTWLSCADTMLFATLASMLDALPAGCPMLFLGTSDAHLEQVDELTASRLRALFPADVLEVGPPCVAARERMFRKLSADAAASPAPPSKKTVARPRKLRKAPPLPPPEPSPAEIAARRAARVASEREMRACLREVCFVLGSDRRFREWARPVDPSTEAGAEYVEVVGAPMELARLLERVNGRTVTCRSAFEAHLRRIVECAEAFYGADGSRGAAMGLADPMRPIANAHTLLDEALELLDEIDPKLVEEAEALAAAQARAGHAQADPKSKQRLGASKLPADAQIDDAQPGGQRAAASGSASAARPQGDGADGIAASDAAMARRARAEHRARLSPTRDEASIAVAEPPVAPAQCGPADEEPSLSELPVAISNMDNAISELGETVDRPNGGADVIDAEALEEWVASYVQRVVEATEGWSVGEVEALALDLWKCVHAHHSKPSEGQLRSDLQGGLERHISRCKSRKEKC